jgi:HD-GYP domain-containing protein (c-di-GMP phosphodiesterase class II)
MNELNNRMKPPPSLSEAVNSLVINLMSALRNSLMYSPSHAQVSKSLELAEEAARRAFVHKEEITFVCIEKEIIFQSSPMNKKGIHFQKFGDVMFSVGLQRITFLPEVTAGEIKRLLLDVAGRNEAGEEAEIKTIRASTHIKIGRLVVGGGYKDPALAHASMVQMLAGLVGDDVDLKSEGKEVAGEALEEVELDFLNVAQEAVSSLRFGDGARPDLKRKSIMDFIHYFLKYSESVFAIAPLKEHDELTFNHSINVCMLTSVQAQFLRVPPENLRDIALAGLLHDVGKLMLPPDLLNKAEPLTPKEKIYFTKHPVIGARLLACTKGVPRMAVTAAYEHHIRFDEEGGYPKSRRCRSPHIVSQMIALADFYDALQTDKPYRPAKSPETVMDMIEERSGSNFNPFLVLNFIKIIKSFSNAVD